MQFNFIIIFFSATIAQKLNMMLMMQQHQQFFYQNKQILANLHSEYTQNDQQCFLKIQKNFEQTKKNNRKKQLYERFILRNLRMYYLPIIACEWLSGLPQLKNIKQLDLSQMDLRSIKYLPNFPTLIRLNLTMNFLTDSQIIFLLNFPNLQILYLTQNRIQKINSLIKLAGLRKLKQIDISGNPMQYDRRQLFDAIQNLKIVDRFSRAGNDLQRNGLFNDNDDEQQEQQQEQEEEEQQNSDQESEMEQRELSNIIYESVGDQLGDQCQIQDQQSQQQSQSESQQQSDSQSQKQNKVKIKLKKEEQQQQDDQNQQDSQMVEQKRQVKKEQKDKNKQKVSFEQAEKRLKKILESLR